MSIKEIQELIKLIAKTELSEFKYENGDLKLHVRGQSYVGKQGSVAPGAAPSIINVPAAPAYAPAPAP
ncbi:MAG: acetyl-CoA carboxylase, biotin carboxyl carrier protein, partial [Bacteroidota bacterium]